MSDLQKLVKRIEENDLFPNDERTFLLCFKEAFHTEIQYLQSAYVANTAPPKSSSCLSPSEILLNERYKEIDRTFTGILALYWIYHRDYHRFTQNQFQSVKLSEASFTQLCDFFHHELDHFKNAEKVLTLLTIQIGNDLGKSEQLQHDFLHASAGGAHHVNHDMLMHHILRDQPNLIPSIYHSSQRASIHNLIQLASEFNPGQLVQGESPPALLDVLHEVDITVEDLRMKFMEIFLDVSGAYGHIDHEGAFTMTETVFQSYHHARRVSEDVLRGGSTASAWRRILANRLHILKNGGWQGADMLDLSHAQHRAKARLFCMARAAQPEIADLVVQAFDQGLDRPTRELLTAGLTRYGTVSHPAVLPTYMPEMFGLLLKKTTALSVDARVNALAALMRYLARTLHLTKEDRKQLENGVVVVEREVKDILGPILESEDFMVQPWLTLHGTVQLPGLQVARRLQPEQYVACSNVNCKI